LGRVQASGISLVCNENKAEADEIIINRGKAHAMHMNVSIKEKKR
jgi:hypothetical protein